MTINNIISKGYGVIFGIEGSGGLPMALMPSGVAALPQTEKISQAGLVMKL